MARYSARQRVDSQTVGSHRAGSPVAVVSIADLACSRLLLSLNGGMPADKHTSRRDTLQRRLDNHLTPCKRSVAASGGSWFPLSLWERGSGGEVEGIRLLGEKRAQYRDEDIRVNGMGLAWKRLAPHIRQDIRQRLGAVMHPLRAGAAVQHERRRRD